MSLLKTVVLLNVVKVITADDDGPLHLHLLDNTGKNSSTDRNIAGERAFLVNVGALNSLTGSFESKTNIPMVSQIFLFLTTLLVQEDSGLLLEGLFVLKDMVEKGNNPSAQIMQHG